MSKDLAPSVIIPVERVEYVDRNITINERRAPTDESVKLLREMEEKARDEVLKSVAVANMGISCVVHMAKHHVSDQTCWRAVFKLNGEILKAEIWRPSISPQTGVADVFEALRDEMAKVIATKSLMEPFARAMQARWARS